MTAAFEKTLDAGWLIIGSLPPTNETERWREDYLATKEKLRATKIKRALKESFRRGIDVTDACQHENQR